MNMRAILTDRPIHNNIVAVEIVVSRSLLDDAAFDSAAYIARQCEEAARAFMNDAPYTYRYLTPAEYGYNAGPFDYRHTPGDLPAHAALIVGRVRLEAL